MSDELKTVKEIETSTVTIEGGCFDDTEESVVIASELRVEAVKWVKELERQKSLKGVDRVLAEGGRRWIVHFFNLTEEELK